MEHRRKENILILTVMSGQKYFLSAKLTIINMPFSASRAKESFRVSSKEGKM